MILQRLAVSDDVRRRDAYWRGPGVPRPDGGLDVAPDGRLDLGTWLNAAPVGWWRTVLGVDAVRLTVVGRGALTVWVARGGVRRELSGAELAGRSGPGSRFELDVRLDDLDWAWIELAAGPEGGELERATWELPSLTDDELPRPLTVVVPTFRAEDDALAQLARLTAPALAGVVGHVVLIDQGGALATHRGAADALAAAGERLLLVEQPNLGGSGGYSRGLLEGAERWPEDPVFLHDDDAQIDPEVLRRLQVLAARRLATFFGTGLLDADAPTSLGALAEGVARRTFRWGPTDGVGDGVDVGVGTPESWSFTRPNDRAEYGGWWGCVVPAGAVRRLGLAAPFFLKWDDAEYGLRAGRAGFAVATLPGFAVWHPTWAAKGTIASWSSWPLHRNRLATAAAYGGGRGVLRDSLIHQVKHVLSLQYATAELWNAALAELLDGPGWLTRDLTSVRPRAQALLDAMPAARPIAPAPSGPSGPASARRPLSSPRAAVRALAGLLRPAGGAELVSLAAPRDFGWADGLGRDAVVFDDGAAPLVRDPRRARRALGRTVALHVRAVLRWRELRRAYADALPSASSIEAWERRFHG